MSEASYSPIFFKYDCGCIGSAPDSEGLALIVVACDSEGDNVYCFSFRGGFNTKQAKALTRAEHIELVGNIRELIIDGYNLRRVKRLLS